MLVLVVIVIFIIVYYDVNTNLVPSGPKTKGGGLALDSFSMVRFNVHYNNARCVLQLLFAVGSLLMTVITHI